MNGGDLVIRKNLHGLEGIAQVTVRPRAVENRMAHVGTGWPAPAASANRLIGLFHARALLAVSAENYYRE
jgi:hypothetical protein